MKKSDWNPNQPSKVSEKRDGSYACRERGQVTGEIRNEPQLIDTSVRYSGDVKKISANALDLITFFANIEKKDSITVTQKTGKLTIGPNAKYVSAPLVDSSITITSSTEADTGADKPTAIENKF